MRMRQNQKFMNKKSYKKIKKTNNIIFYRMDGGFSVYQLKVDYTT